MVVGSEYVTRDDGIAALGVVFDNPGWEHLIVDVSKSDAPEVLSRNEELEGLHHLARIVRDLPLADGFQIAIVTSPVSAARVADFIDLSHSLDIGIDVAAFTTVEDALAWLGAELLIG
ncbi:MAG: hypothetical protein AAGE98_15100 [Actinomycetota bacterium]